MGLSKGIVAKLKKAGIKTRGQLAAHAKEHGGLDRIDLGPQQVGAVYEAMKRTQPAADQGSGEENATDEVNTEGVDSDKETEEGQGNDSTGDEGTSSPEGAGTDGQEAE